MKFPNNSTYKSNSVGRPKNSFFYGAKNKKYGKVSSCTPTTNKDVKSLQWLLLGGSGF